MLTLPKRAQESITNIAYAAGFSNSAHFSNLFRAKFGMRPSDLRRSGARKADLEGK
jgi:transcriptional regulator GlxA family with amidase domain